jgi:hypothetical protein
MLGFVAFSQAQVLSRCLLRFLDKSMQQYHSASLIDVEQDAGNSVLTEARPHFIDTFAYRPANGHADRPPKLDSLNGDLLV